MVVCGTCQYWFCEKSAPIILNTTRVVNRTSACWHLGRVLIPVWLAFSEFWNEKYADRHIKTKWFRFITNVSFPFCFNAIVVRTRWSSTSRKSINRVPKSIKDLTCFQHIVVPCYRTFCILMMTANVSARVLNSLTGPFFKVSTYMKALHERQPAPCIYVWSWKMK